MITLIVITITLTCLVILCMIYIINCDNTNKKQEKKILYILGELDKIRIDIWGIQHPPKYKIGDEVRLHSSILHIIRDIKLHTSNDAYAEDFYYYRYLLDDKNPKYQPMWYDERMIQKK